MDAKGMQRIRRPAEFDTIRRVWVSAPHNVETWPGEGVLQQAQAQFATFTAALRKVVEVVDVASLGIETQDSWIRDYGPCYVTVRGELMIRDFGFNAWGQKYGDGAIDNKVNTRIAERTGVSRSVVPMVLEGGGVESDGRGVGLSTASCLFNPTRNPDLDRETIEQTVKSALGFERLLILPGGDIEGDDTDGHIDNLVRFLSPQLLAVSRAAAGHPARAVTEANWLATAELRRLNGQPYERIALPVPEPIAFDYPGDQWTPARQLMLPASYANFVMANGTLFVPTFGQPSDESACRLLDDATGRDWRVVPIRSEWLVVGQGGLHCLTQHEPPAWSGW